VKGDERHAPLCRVKTFDHALLSAACQLYTAMPVSHNETEIECNLKLLLFADSSSSTKVFLVQSLAKEVNISNSLIQVIQKTLYKVQSIWQ